MSVTDCYRTLKVEENTKSCDIEKYFVQKSKFVYFDIISIELKLKQYFLPI